MDDSSSPNPPPPASPDTSATIADESAAHALAIARAADQAAESSLAILRAIAHALLWAIGGMCFVIVADSLPWGLSDQPWIRGAALLPMIVIGLELGRRSSPRMRRRIATVVALLIGGLAGYAIDRIGGALLIAPIAAAVIWLLVFIIDALVPRLSPLWRLRLIWGAWACLISSAMLAGLLRMVTGRLDGDDFAFHVMAGVIAILLANHHGWFADADLSLANVLRKLRAACAILLHRRLLPFVVAVVLAFLLAGPWHEQLHITEGDGMTIASAPADYAWPACIAGAAVLAIALTWGGPAPIFRKAMGLLTAVCIYTLISSAVLSARFDDQSIEARSSIWNRYGLERNKVTHITYERRTGRRTVSYLAVIHLTDGTTTNIGSDSLSWRAVKWMRDQWGVEERKGR